MTTPDVSVLIATYNRAGTLRQAIDSVLMQTHPAREVLVADDGSTDRTRELLESYGARIVPLYLDHQGAARARNAALARARGRFVAFLDSDDYYLNPEVLLDYADCFQTSPGLDVVSSGWRTVDPQGKPLAELAPWDRAPVFDLAACLIWKPTILSAKLFRREILDRVGGFDPDFEAAMDTDLIFRILLAGGKIGWLRKITLGYRQSPVSIMQNAPGQERFLLRAVDRVFASPSLPAEVRRRENEIRHGTDLWLAWYLWSRGFPADAAGRLSASLRFHSEDPFIRLKNWRRQFDIFSTDNGIRRIGLDELLDLALPILPLPSGEVESIRSLFGWWWRAWIPLSGGEESPPPAVAFPAGVSARGLVKLAQRCISTGREITPTEVVDRLWRDARQAGAVPAGEKYEVITLYLTCFVRALMARKPGPALRSLGSALFHSGSWRAARPWWRFVRSSLRFLLRRPEAAPEAAA
jgi:glycosyltransferase involved in cell wall biosynthesis